MADFCRIFNIYVACSDFLIATNGFVADCSVMILPNIACDWDSNEIMCREIETPTSSKLSSGFMTV